MKTNSPKAWLLAARPKTLTGAAVPVLIGTALALSSDTFQALPALLCLLFAFGMQIAANFINDLYDFLKGTDREDRLGPERACSQGWITASAMKRGTAVAFLLSCLTGSALLYTGYGALPYQGVELIVVGLLCVLFAILYTTKLSYNGLGDLLVLAFFGWVPVCGTYYVQAYTVTLDAWIAATACGLVIDTLLVVNNYRDRDQDALSGKRTLIVRFGEPFGRYAYLGLGIAAAALMVWFSLRHAANDPNRLITQILLASFYLFTHYRTWRKLCVLRSGKQLNLVLGETSRNILLFGLLFCAALLL